MPHQLDRVSDQDLIGLERRMSREQASKLVRDIGEISRRCFLHRSAGGFATLTALAWSDIIKLHAADLQRRGMSCILLWMQGGPSQFETFDPKPNHENGGSTRAIETAVPGIHIAEHWPQVARELEDIAIIRSMTNREGNHQRATYQLHTGFVPSVAVGYPAFGSVVASELGDSKSALPNFVVVGRGGRGQRLSGGFLGAEFDPFVVGRANRKPENTVLPVRKERFSRRMELLNRLEKEFAVADGDKLVAEHQTLYRRASQLSLSSRLKAFDIKAESAQVKEAYGDTDFGRGCLLARRLVEAGVTFVEVRSGGWDTHNDNFTRTKDLSAQVDPAFAQLVRDLRDRGRLETTLIVWMGEFGRTPRINPRSGRDHFPRAFSVAMSGGTVKGGRAIGQTTANGMDVTERPVTVPDFFCTLCHALGIDPQTENFTSLGRPIKIVDGGEVVKELFS